jgi:hypothetical protein
MLRAYSLDTPMKDVGTDMPALSKMNSNSTQLNGALAIPIRAARQVGRVLKVPAGRAQTVR